MANKGGGGNDWRRKFTGVSSKDIARSKTPSIASASGKSKRSNTLSTPAKPLSPSSEPDTVSPSSLNLGSVIGDCRDRARSDKSGLEGRQSERATESNLSVDLRNSPTLGDKSLNSRVQGQPQFDSHILRRKPSQSSPTSHQPIDTNYSPTQKAESRNTSGDEDDLSVPTRRGSVIGNVARKAKLVLPLKRSSANFKAIGIRSSPSSASMQESPANLNPSRVSNQSTDEDGDRESTQNRLSLSDARPTTGTGPTSGQMAIASPFKPTSPTAPKRREHISSLSAGDPAIIPRRQDFSEEISPHTPASISASNILRPRSVPPRHFHDASAPQKGLSPISKPVSSQVSPKLMDLQHTNPVSSSVASGPSQNSLSSISPVNVSSLGLAQKRSGSLLSIQEDSRQSSGTEYPGFEDSFSHSPTSASNTPQGIVALPKALRTTSSLKFTSLLHGSSTEPNAHAAISRQRRPALVSEPCIPDPAITPKVEPAPPSGMYWSHAMVSGYGHPPLRAHTATLVGQYIFVFGGCDSKTCFNDLYVFDCDSLFWAHPACSGESPPPSRAMTATAVGKKLVIFGGGDGPSYFNEVYVLDSINFRWTRAKVTGKPPSKRRAHTACLYKSGIYIFGGGDGIKALNDVWRLDVSDLNKMSWKLISPATTVPPNPIPEAQTHPTSRGYHTANIVSSNLLIYGGSDGLECFCDVWIFSLTSSSWKRLNIPFDLSFRRLSHTATIIGSYLFVIGGHDGITYSNDVLLLNLVTMNWSVRKVYGQKPAGKGYHGTVVYDGRIFVMGGFDGQAVYDDTHILELAVSAYYSQISHFTIDV